jgi:hypothetical protein
VVVASARPSLVGPDRSDAGATGAERPACAILRDNKVVGTLTIEVLGGQIQTIRSVIKPDKLKNVDPVAAPGRSSENSAGSPAHGLTGRADCAPDT